MLSPSIQAAVLSVAPLLCSFFQPTPKWQRMDSNAPFRRRPRSIDDSGGGPPSALRRRPASLRFSLRLVVNALCALRFSFLLRPPFLPCPAPAALAAPAAPLLALAYAINTPPPARRLHARLPAAHLARACWGCACAPAFAHASAVYRSACVPMWSSF